MKIIFKVIFDTESGDYSADTDSIKSENDKASVEEIAEKVSSMFTELSTKYYNKILTKATNYIEKINKEEMN
jgi:phosphoenolpyruvate carboxylase